MKFNLSTITLSIGLSLGIAAYANVAEARVVLNGSSLTGKVSRPTSQEHNQQQNKIITFNGSSLTGKKAKSK